MNSYYSLDEMDIYHAQSQLESLTAHISQAYAKLEEQIITNEKRHIEEKKTISSDKLFLANKLVEKEETLSTLTDKVISQKQQIESLTAEVASQKQQIASLEKQTSVKQTPEPVETPENKFDMLRSQAKEISAKDKEIMRLTKEIVKLKELNEVTSNVTMTVVESPEPVEGWSPTTSTTPKPDKEVPEISLEETPTDSEVNKVEVVDDEDEDDEDEDDEDEALFEITYRKIKYYRDNNNKVYEKLDDGEPGNYIGDWIKDGTYKSGNDKYKLVKL